MRGADQAFTSPAGVCFRPGDGGLDNEVECARPHSSQSVGPATLAVSPGGDPPSAARFTELASAACAPLVDPYLRQSHFDGASVGSGWHLIADESWRAGTRTTTCLVRFVDAAGNPKDVAGVLAPGSAAVPGTVAT